MDFAVIKSTVGGDALFVVDAFVLSVLENRPTKLLAQRSRTSFINLERIEKCNTEYIHCARVAHP